MATTTAPSPLTVSNLKVALDRLAAWSPEWAEVLRGAANTAYAAHTLTAEHIAALHTQIREANAAGRYTDAYLRVEVAAGHGGYARAAGYLLTVPEHARAAVADEANLRTNLSGGRYADNVSSACANWQSLVTPRAGYLRDLAAFTGQPDKQAKVRQAAQAAGVAL